MALGLAPALAQNWPTKPVRIINPYAAGGPTELVARELANALSVDLGQQFIVESRPGGGTIIGAEIVAIVPNTNMADLCRLAEHMRRRVAESPLQVEHSRGARATPMTVTIGASLYERESVLRVNTGVDSAPQLMRAAMFALASGRSQGRNRVVFFRREMQPNTP